MTWRLSSVEAVSGRGTEGGPARSEDRRGEEEKKKRGEGAVEGVLQREEVAGVTQETVVRLRSLRERQHVAPEKVRPRWTRSRE